MLSVVRPTPLRVDIRVTVCGQPASHAHQNVSWREREAWSDGSAEVERQSE